MRRMRDARNDAAIEGTLALARPHPKACFRNELASRGSAGRLLASILLVLALASTQAAAQGCAMCGAVVSSGKDPLARGMFLSILLMLAVPNVLIVSLGCWLVYTYRRAAFRVAGEALPAGETGRAGGTGANAAGRTATSATPSEPFSPEGGGAPPERT